MRTPPRRRWLFGLAACAYLLLHVATLSRSPVAYFDDTFFASIGDSLARTGELRLRAGPLWMDGPIYMYGPAYFLAQSVIFQWFGLGIVQNRVLGLVGGIGLVLVVFASLRAGRVPRRVALAASGLLALDPTLHLAMHSGRMDNVALFFVLASFLVLQKSWADEQAPRLPLCAASGLLAALAVLTTPRPAYLVVGLGIILLLRLARVRSGARALQLLCWAVPLATVYLSWVWYAFGGLAELRAYYAQFSSTYVGGRLTVRAIHVPLLALFAAAGVLRLWKGPRLRVDELGCFALGAVVAFYALGINPPRFGTVYTVLTIPFLYMALARVVADLPEPRQRVVVFALLLAFNGAVLGARTTLELIQWRARDPAPIDAAMRTFIPPGSKVIGDDRFYFAVRNAGADFQYWQRGGTQTERVAYHTGDYRFDYLVTTEAETSTLFRAYARRVALVKVATFAHHERSVIAEWLSAVARAGRSGSPLVADYDAAIYARADRPAPRSDVWSSR